MNSILDFIFRNNVLKTDKKVILKSKEESDHFYNFGKICSAKDLSYLGTYMASQIYGEEFGVLFTSAYKGIMIATAVLLECSSNNPDKDYKIGYLRKENKDHGEGGNVIGHCPTPTDVVVLVDDVLTSGSSLIEMSDFVKSTGAKIESAVVIVRRCSHEKQGELEESLGFPIRCLVSDDQYLKYQNTQAMDFPFLACNIFEPKIF